MSLDSLIMYRDVSFLEEYYNNLVGALSKSGVRYDIHVDEFIDLFSGSVVFTVMLTNSEDFCKVNLPIPDKRLGYAYSCQSVNSFVVRFGMPGLKGDKKVSKFRRFVNKIISI